MRKLFILLYLAVVLPLSAQVYYLPKTAIRIHLLIEKRTYTPGEFSHYAKRYLQLDHIQQQQQVQHRVVSCELSTLGVRDTSKCFTLQLKGKGEAADIRLSSEGILQAVNDTPLPAPDSPYRSMFQTTKASQPAVQPKTYLSAEALAAGSTAKMAELTALQITELRQRRQLLATGEADEMPQDERQLQRMLNEIDHQCNMLTMLFSGITRRDTIEQAITICPMEETSRQVVFRLSSKTGIVDSDDLSGIPFYLTLKNLHPTSNPIPDNKKGDGIFVNVPSTIQLSLYQEDQLLATFDIPMAQFGYLQLLDGTPFKRYVTHLTLHPATGAVVKQYSDTE
jgi:hypothetical protein